MKNLLNVIILLLSLLYIKTAAAIEWDYSAVEKTGKYCPIKDSCSTGRRSRITDEIDWKERNCFCDPECAVYGDCCIDAPVFNPVEQKLHTDKFTCLELTQYGHVYVRSRCPQEWRDKAMNKKCLHNDEGDPFGSSLVTSRKSGITYRNYHCAVCNSDSGDLRMWTHRLECPTLQGLQARFQNLTKEYLYDNLKQNPVSGKWGVELDIIGIPVFHDCRLDPFMPDDITPLVRKCHPESHNITKSCPPDFKQQPQPAVVPTAGGVVDLALVVDIEEVDDLNEAVADEQLLLVDEEIQGDALSSEEIVELCESYTAVMFNSKSSQTYRNPHCALCHGVNPAEDLICLNLNIMGRSGLRFLDRFNPIAFSVLFDIDRSDGHEVGVVGEDLHSCGKLELWDPFFKKCRNIVCGEEGKVFQNGVCYDKDNIPTTTSTTTSTTTTTTTTTTTSTTTSTTSTTTTSTTTTTTDDSFVRFPDNFTDENYYDESSVNETAIENINFPEEAPSVNIPVDTFSSSTTTTSTTTTTTTTTSTTRRTTTVTTTTRLPPTTTSTTTTSTTTMRSTVTLTTLNSSVQHYPQLSTCTRVELNKEEYRIVSGRAIIEKYNNLQLGPEQYYPQGEDIVICEHKKEESETTKFSPIMGYVTFICLGLSMVCLVFHLLVTLIAPELQNLSGKNLFSFALALLGSYGCFLANMLAVDIEYEFCFVLAIFMYYFYLATFCWMLNIASNVAKTLRLATTQLRFSSGAQWGRFLVNCVIGWILPAVLVVGVALIDRLDIPEIPFQFKPGFGSSQIGLCWFSSRTALLIYFVAPFSLIMLLNVGFFASSSCMVWESARSTAKITATGPRISFFLYLRLALLMGMTWVSGLVAGIVDLEPVWYVFLVLNTLQGLFILLFFTCSKKVVNSVKERLIPATSDTDSSLWKWKIQDNGSGGSGSGASSDSADSNLSVSGLAKHRSAYEQYHKYDQRFYSP